MRTLLGTPAITRFARWHSLLLCLVLLASQTLGQLHGLAHLGGHHHLSPGHPSSPVTTAVQAQVGEEDHAGHDHAHGAASASHMGEVLAHLFASHDEASSDCLAFDQLSHADALPSLPIALPMAMTSFQLACSAGLAVARWHAQFQARGPPLAH